MHQDFPRGSSAFSRVDFSSKITSLDQLCAQATGLDPILRAKVQEWALGSQGHFRYTDDHGNQDFILWQDVWEDPDKIERIRFAKLKTVGRAVEKLMRSYRCLFHFSVYFALCRPSGTRACPGREDVSRLLDVCRQSIVFENVKDLIACVHLIQADPEVTIVRVKNRLDPSYNSYASAGYRDLALNMRICNEHSSHIAVDAHVCEVQLLLKEVARIKNEDGHKRYIHFRNMRGQ